MTKYNLCILFFCLGSLAFSQDRSEREHRIRKSQFPPIQTDLSILKNEKTKRVRYYREIDGTEITYSYKFKLDRLHYHIDFNSDGLLKNSGLRVQQIDIPDDTYNAINSYLKVHFEKIKIKSIFQEYPVQINDEEQTNILKNTLQNLLLPDNLYKLNISGKQLDKSEDFELWFNSAGEYLRTRTALPANFDRILY